MVRGTGEFRDIPVQAVYRAVGYYGTPVVDAPFDEERGVIPNVEGRVDRDWRRGPRRSRASTRPAGSSADPVGLIGHTKSDAMETIAHLVADAAAGRLARARRSTATCSTCSTSARSRTRRGTAGSPSTRTSARSAPSHRHTRERVKVVPRDEQVEISRAGSLTAVVTYVIALPCVDVKDRACIDECPVDCIYEGERSLYIHPDECVDCGACEPVCPVEAIYYEDDLPEEWQDYYTANVEFFDDIGSPGGAAKVGVYREGPPPDRRTPAAGDDHG